MISWPDFHFPPINLYNVWRNPLMLYYDFACPECKLVKEIFVRSASVPAECPICGALMKRLPASPGNFSSSGQGFFKPQGNVRGKK